MFGKLYTAIKVLNTSVIDCLTKLTGEHRNTRELLRNEQEVVLTALGKMESVIASQQHTIEQLTYALKDKYKHGLFVLSDGRNIPLVIKDGEKLNTDFATFLRVTWSYGEVPTVETEQMVGHCFDTEE